MDTNSAMEESNVTLPTDKCRDFVATREKIQPKTERGLTLLDEVWLEILRLLCVTHARGPQIRARTTIILPELVDFDKRLAEDYELVVAQRNILR